MMSINNQEIPYITIVDIGASGGLDRRWLNFKTKGILVEPDPREVENLRKSLPENYSLITNALSCEEGKRTFYLYRKQQSSSFYKPNLNFIKKFPESERLEVVSTIEIDTQTLDRSLNLVNECDIDLIKIDVEGHELSIFSGAEKTFESLIAIETEVNFAEVRFGAPLFGDVDVYLHKKGFSLIDLRKTYWLRRNIGLSYYHKGQLILGDAIYFLLPDKVFSKFSARPNKCFNALVVYLAYNYYDLALEIYGLCSNTIWSPELTKVAKSMLDEAKPKKSNLLLAKIFNKLSQFFRKIAGEINWYSGDSRIGN